MSINVNNTNRIFTQQVDSQKDVQKDDTKKFQTVIYDAVAPQIPDDLK